MIKASVLTAALLATGVGSQVRAADSTLRVTFTMSPLFDPACYAAIQKPVDEPMVNAAREHLTAWQADWEHEAPRLVAATVSLTRLPFQFHETAATVITCPAFISMAAPLLLNVRQLLDRSKQGVASEHEFSEMVFHEVLHRYVAERIRSLPGATTPAWDKYKGEPQPVRSHIYVEAIMELVYR
jgi:hypothetical protein